MDLRELNQLIKETVDREFRSTRSRTKSSHQKKLIEGLKRAKLIIEGEDSQGVDDSPSGKTETTPVDSMSLATDINKMSPEALAAAAFGGAGADTLLNTMKTVADWAPKALGKAKVTDAASMGAQAKAIFGDEATLVNRIKNINKALAASQGFDKSEMPAFEAIDYLAIKDALDGNDGGQLAVDFDDEYSGNMESVINYHAQQTGELQSAEGEDSEGTIADGYVRWNKLAGIEAINEINDDKRFPFAGAYKVMPGAANRGSDKKKAFDLSKTSGLAKTFLTKGKGTGDSTPVSPQVDMDNSAMKPTQTNIKAAKSMLFAFANSGLDMGGAFADQEGNILDGHHRWSGQHLRTGGQAKHKGVHIITRPSDMDVPTFLTMLTSLGQALGRPTKR